MLSPAPPVAASSSLAGHLAALAGRVNRRLPELLPPPGQRPAPVHEAMHYALTGAGKRVRPVLTLAVAIYRARQGLSSTQGYAPSLVPTALPPSRGSRS